MNAGRLFIITAQSVIHAHALHRPDRALTDMGHQDRAQKAFSKAQQTEKKRLVFLLQPDHENRTW